MPAFEPYSELSEGVSELSNVVFGLDHDRARDAEQRALRLIRRIRVDPGAVWEAGLLAHVGDVVRLLGQVQADLTGDLAGADALADTYLGLVERGDIDAEDLYCLRAKAAEIKASARHRAGDYRGSVSFARIAYRLVDADVVNALTADPIRRRALALQIAGTRELARLEGWQVVRLDGFIRLAETLCPPVVGQDLFDRDGINQLASQTFYAVAERHMDNTSLSRWYWRAARARSTRHPRHEVTRPLLDAAYLRALSNREGAVAAERRALEGLLAHGLYRHLASLTRRQLWHDLDPPATL